MIENVARGGIVGIVTLKYPSRMTNGAMSEEEVEASDDDGGDGEFVLRTQSVSHKTYLGDGGKREED